VPRKTRPRPLPGRFPRRNPAGDRLSWGVPRDGGRDGDLRTPPPWPPLERGESRVTRVRSQAACLQMGPARQGGEPGHTRPPRPRAENFTGSRCVKLNRRANSHVLPMLIDQIDPKLAALFMTTEKHSRCGCLNRDGVPSNRVRACHYRRASSIRR
jgi:hypothetical protein